MKRFVLQQLIEWKNREDRKPLILNGAPTSWENMAAP